MGLDNGIRILHPEERPPFYIWRQCDTYYEPFCYEICYWRRCWDYRDKILKEIGVVPIEEDENAKITDKQLKSIQKMLWGYCHWKHKHKLDCNWGYWYMVKKNVRDIIAIQWMRRYLKRHPDAVIYFYDSY